MQATTRLHDGVANAVPQEAYLVFHHPIAFHTPNRVFDADSDRCDRTIMCFRWWGEFTTTRFFLRLDHGDTVEDKALEAHILVEATAVGQGIALQLSQAFIIRLPFIRGTQETNLTGLINYEEVFDRMAFLLAAVVVLLILWIGWAVDRSLRTIMPKRGDKGPPFARFAASITAKSSAVRAGRSSWRAKAQFNTVCRRWIHLFAFDWDMPKSCPCTS